MCARLVYREKYVYADGAIREMVLWQVPGAGGERPHRLKYRLFYGLADGTCVFRYDNETGKGDHRHIRGKEKPCSLRDAENLVADFLADIERARRGADEERNPDRDR